MEKAFHVYENEKKAGGVPIVAQWLMNLTRNHEVAGSIPDLGFLPSGWCHPRSGGGREVTAPGHMAGALQAHAVLTAVLSTARSTM